MKISYSTIKIPTILLSFFLGIGGFLGFGSFCRSIFNSDNAGYIGGCFAFIFIISSFYRMEKRNAKQKNNKQDDSNEKK